MGVIIRQSFKNSLYSYAGFAIGAFNTLWIPRILEKAQIGLFNTLVAYSWITATILSLGIPAIIIRFYPKYKNINPGTFIFTCLGIPLIAFGLFFGVFYIHPEFFLGLLKTKEELFLQNYQWAFFMAFGTLYFEVFSAFLKTYFVTGPAILLRELGLRIFNLLIYVLYWQEMIDFKTLTVLYACSYVGILFVLGIFTFQKISLPFKVGKIPEGGHELMSFGLYSLANTGIVYVVFQLDIVMLQSYKGLSEVALYNIALFAATAIQMPYRAMGTIALPVIAKSFQTNDMVNVKSVYQKSSLNMILLGGILLILLLSCISDMKFFLPAEYRNGLEAIVLLLGLAKWIDMASGLNGMIINQSKYYRVDVIANAILLGSAITCNLLLIPVYGIRGAALATLISLVLYNAIRYIYVVYRFRMSAFTPKSILSVFVLLGIYFLVNILPDLANPIYNIVLKSVTAVLLFFVSLRLLKLSDELNAIIDKGFVLLGFRK